MKYFLFVLVLAVSVSMANQPSATGRVAGGTSSHGSDAEVVLWSQLPTGGLMGSQNFTDFSNYDAGVADDFEFLTSTTVNKIRWWGGYFNGSGTVPVDSLVEIYLYHDDGTGNAPTLPQHTSAFASWMVPPGSYTEVADGTNYKCEYVFPVLITFNPNMKYWIEIRKAFAFNPLGQYGWIRSTPISLSPCVQGFDGMGVIWWTAQTTDAAFELIFDDAVPLERSTWADIKTIF